jgi:orotate phosphoribosyltransferase
MGSTPTSPPSAREQLLYLLARESFRLGDFKLSSGAKSDYYVDCRATTLHAEGVRLAGRVLFDLIKEKRWQPRAIGGMTLGADPLVTAVALLSAQSIVTRAPARTKPLDFPDEFLIHGFVVRKQEKEHGTGQRIEGYSKRGARVIIVDDVCTTGASTIQAVAAAKAAGMEIIAAVCLVEREEAGGRAAVEKAIAPAPFVSIFKANELREIHTKLQAP